MYKEHLCNSIIKEIKICSRLYTKIPHNKMDFRPKEGMRSTEELLQYLSWCGAGMLGFWLNKDGLTAKEYFQQVTAKAKEMKHENFLSVMKEKMETVEALFDQIGEEDLMNMEVKYPWGTTAPLGEAIMETSVKWMASYKLQLFLYIKLCTNDKLVTPDAWVYTELSE